MVLRCPVMFDADVDPTFDAERAVDEDNERRLDDKKISGSRRASPNRIGTNELLSGEVNWCR